MLLCCSVGKKQAGCIACSQHPLSFVCDERTRVPGHNLKRFEYPRVCKCNNRSPLRANARGTSCSCQLCSTLCTASLMLAVLLEERRAVRAERKEDSVALDQEDDIHTCIDTQRITLIYTHGMHNTQFLMSPCFD